MSERQGLDQNQSFALRRLDIYLMSCDFSDHWLSPEAFS
jgi:hypothetical protein